MAGNTSTGNSKTVNFELNGEKVSEQIKPEVILMDYLRDSGLKSVKAGCREGDCGSCAVLINGVPTNSCVIKIGTIEGKKIETLESMGTPLNLHPLQQSFLETGAIQCGFCTPAQILTAKALLDKNPRPTETEVREVLAPVMCRCTGYVRIVDAVMRAAARLRGETPPEYSVPELKIPADVDTIELPPAYYRRDGNTAPLPPLVLTPAGMSELNMVGKSPVKVDGVKLVTGKPAFTDDVQPDGLLFGALLTSPHAHARIRDIDVSKAMALPGVRAVLTYKDIPRIKYSTGGQSYPQPLPYDQVVLDDKVRHVGDRVAVLAADNREIAEKALQLIEVDYEVLPHVLDAEEAMQDGAPVVHDESDTEAIHDPQHNTVYHIETEVGQVDAAFAECDTIHEGEFRTPKQQHGQLEPHICITYMDEDDRLVVRTSTQVPFHVRRIIAPLIGLPEKKIRVIKPRIGGGFGGKQEIMLEELCSLLTLKTGKPVRLEYTRSQEFTSGRSRHRQIIRYKLGVKDEKLIAAELRLIGDTGAYATHGLTVNMVGGFKGLTLYNAPNSRFICDVVYTNTPPAGAYRGYGAMQEQFAVEVMMEQFAEKLGVDVVEFKRKNWIKLGEPMHLATKLGEGKEGYEQSMATTAIDECVRVGIKATDYYAKREKYKNQTGPVRKGIGFSIMMHGSGIAGLDMGGATLKMNDDGSFNLMVGATDIGTGSDTILAQIAAEQLGISVDDIIVYSSDTDFTPFDKGAYASSTTYISGGAVLKSAQNTRRQVLEHAAKMLKVDDPETLTIIDGHIIAPDENSVTMREVALSSLHQLDQHQIMATESHMSYVSPPPTAAQFCEVEVNTETGELKIERVLMIVDCGRVINPLTAAGQVEGGNAQALGFTLSEDTYYDKKGRVINDRLSSYKMVPMNEMPPLDVIFIQTDEPTGPYGAKSVAEIATDGVAPATVSAVHNATGVWYQQLPLTQERLLAGLKK
jgi:putative selenate reductase molybdopterin-binding subunit